MHDFNLRKPNKLIFVLISDIVVEVNIRTKDFRTQNPLGLSTVCRTITAADLSLSETLPSAICLGTSHITVAAVTEQPMFSSFRKSQLAYSTPQMRCGLPCFSRVFVYGDTYRTNYG